jgi:hypothetical protein
VVEVSLEILHSEVFLPAEMSMASISTLDYHFTFYTMFLTSLMEEMEHTCSGSKSNHSVGFQGLPLTVARCTGRHLA